ncbi:MAG: DNA methylase [Clostridia bacterium]|nr:DNA methylase [Clostridia bacterium]
MSAPGRQYIAIDLKSFYASVECRARGLDPLTTNLVVADESRTEKTICLAVTPSLKARGVPGRPRLFEVVEKVRQINRERRRAAPGGVLAGKSWDDTALQADPALAVDYLVAPPRMALYMATSTRIYDIYTRFVAPEDIHVYSIDEVFMDVTHYLKNSGLTARQLTRRIIDEVLYTTGITATAGIGTNLYLCKIAMDIVAKRIPADKDGVRIAELDEAGYRRTMWTHRPLTDFWRVGRGTARRLEAEGLYTMGDIARCSAGGKSDYYNEDLLYRLFGVNAELLIDHAWGWEGCTIADIKAYRPESSSLSEGQVLQQPYPADKARLVVREMTDQLALAMVAKKLVCDQVVLTVCYDAVNLQGGDGRPRYRGATMTDFYGREVPQHAHGSENLPAPTSSSRQITGAMLALFDRIVDPALLVRRIYVVANHVIDEDEAARRQQSAAVQLDMFTDYAAEERRQAEADAQRAKERRQQEVVLAIKDKYGKNAILRGMDLEEGATARLRNDQIGGHKA